MLVRLKRIKQSGSFLPSQLDHEFVNGSISDLPEVGESLKFTFDKPGKGWWMTSTVLTLKRHKSFWIIKTRNSTYHLKEGWN